MRPFKGIVIGVAVLAATMSPQSASADSPYCTSVGDYEKGCIAFAAVGGQAVASQTTGTVPGVCQSFASLEVTETTQSTNPPGVSGKVRAVGRSTCTNTSIGQINKIGMRLYRNGVNLMGSGTAYKNCPNSNPAGLTHTCTSDPFTFTSGDEFYLHTWHHWDAVSGAGWVLQSIDGCETVTAVQVRCWADTMEHVIIP